MQSSEISLKRKILSWIPIVGVWMEFCYVLKKDEECYLSDKNHMGRFILSGVYHGLLPIYIYFIIELIKLGLK